MIAKSVGSTNLSVKCGVVGLVSSAHSLRMQRMQLGHDKIIGLVPAMKVGASRMKGRKHQSSFFSKYFKQQKELESKYLILNKIARDCVSAGRAHGESLAKLKDALGGKKLSEKVERKFDKLYFAAKKQWFDRLEVAAEKIQAVWHKFDDKRQAQKMSFEKFEKLLEACHGDLVNVYEGIKKMNDNGVMLQLLFQKLLDKCGGDLINAWEAIKEMDKNDFTIIMMELLFRELLKNSEFQKAGKLLDDIKSWAAQIQEEERKRSFILKCQNLRTEWERSHTKGYLSIPGFCTFYAFYLDKWATENPDRKLRTVVNYVFGTQYKDYSKEDFMEEYLGSEWKQLCKPSKLKSVPQEIQKVFKDYANQSELYAGLSHGAPSFLKSASIQIKMMPRQTSLRQAAVEFHESGVTFMSNENKETDWVIKKIGNTDEMKDMKPEDENRIMKYAQRIFDIDEGEGCITNMRHRKTVKDTFSKFHADWDDAVMELAHPLVLPFVLKKLLPEIAEKKVLNSKSFVEFHKLMEVAKNAQEVRRKFEDIGFAAIARKAKTMNIWAMHKGKRQVGLSFLPKSQKEKFIQNSCGYACSNFVQWNSGDAPGFVSVEKKFIDKGLFAFNSLEVPHAAFRYDKDEYDRHSTEIRLCFWKEQDLAEWRESDEKKRLKIWVERELENQN